MGSKPTNGEWRTAKFGDCARLVTDRVSPQTAGDTPYIGLEHIGESTLSLIGHGTAQDVTSAKTLFKRKDILFGKLRPYFRKVIAAPFDGICSTDIWVVRPKEGVDAGFLFYTMATLGFVERAVRGSNGTRMPRASWDFLSEYELSLPPLPAQRAISRVLGAFDDKIALNARMNSTLEAMARALFRAWFVDFEPVRAKQAGRWRRGETLPGMPAALYDIFPAELTPTELGEAPVGWEARAIGDELATLVSGSRPRGGAVKSGIPSIGAENVLGLGRYDFSKEKYVPPDFFDKLKRRGADVRNGDVLLYKDGAKIGRKTYFDKGFPHADCAVNEHTFILRLHNAAAQRYLYFWLGQDWMTHKIITLNSNTAQPGINQTGVRGLPILMPPDDVLSAFDDIASDMTGRIFANCHESRTLAAMRDTLLPRLLSGEVRVG